MASEANPLSVECVKRICDKMSTDQMMDLVKYIHKQVPDSQKRKWHDNARMPYWGHYKKEAFTCEQCTNDVWTETTFGCEICEKKLCYNCRIALSDNNLIMRVCNDCVMNYDVGNDKSCKHQCTLRCTTYFRGCMHAFGNANCISCDVVLCDCIKQVGDDDMCLSCFQKKNMGLCPHTAHAVCDGL